MLLVVASSISLLEIAMPSMVERRSANGQPFSMNLPVNWTYSSSCLPATSPICVRTIRKSTTPVSSLFDGRSKPYLRAGNPANALTVEAVAHDAAVRNDGPGYISTRPIADVGEPAPFTCVGTGRE